MPVHLSRVMLIIGHEKVCLDVSLFSFSTFFIFFFNDSLVYDINTLFDVLLMFLIFFIFYFWSFLIFYLRIDSFLSFLSLVQLLILLSPFAFLLSHFSFRISIIVPTLNRTLFRRIFAHHLFILIIFYFLFLFLFILLFLFSFLHFIIYFLYQTILNLTLSKIKLQNGFVGKSVIITPENVQKKTQNEFGDVGVLVRVRTNNLTSMSDTTPSGNGNDSDDDMEKKENYNVRN